MISPFWHFLGVYFIGYHLLLCIYHGKWGSLKINHFSLLFNTAGEEKRETNSKNWQLRTFSEINLWKEVAVHTKIHFLKSLHTTVIICLERATCLKQLVAFIYCSIWHARTWFSNRIIFISILLHDGITVPDPRNAFQPKQEFYIMQL